MASYPLLVHDENIIKDSSVICDYIDEIFRGLANAQPLTPEDALKKAEMRSWMRFIEEVPTPTVRVPSFNMAFLSRFKGLPQSQFHNQQSDIRPLRKEFYRRMGPKGFNSEDFESAIEKLQNNNQTYGTITSKRTMADWQVLFNSRYNFSPFTG